MFGDDPLSRFELIFIPHEDKSWIFFSEASGMVHVFREDSQSHVKKFELKVDDASESSEQITCLKQIKEQNQKSSVKLAFGTTSGRVFLVSLDLSTPSFDLKMEYVSLAVTDDVGRSSSGFWGSLPRFGFKSSFHQVEDVGAVKMIYSMEYVNSLLCLMDSGLCKLLRLADDSLSVEHIQLPEAVGNDFLFSCFKSKVFIAAMTSGHQAKVSIYDVEDSSVQSPFTATISLKSPIKGLIAMQEKSCLLFTASELLLVLFTDGKTVRTSITTLQPSFSVLAARGAHDIGRAELIVFREIVLSGTVLTSLQAGDISVEDLKNIQIPSVLLKECFFKWNFNDLSLPLVLEALHSKLTPSELCSVLIDGSKFIMNGLWSKSDDSFHIRAEIHFKFIEFALNVPEDWLSIGNQIKLRLTLLCHHESLTILCFLAEFSHFHRNRKEFRVITEIQGSFGRIMYKEEVPLVLESFCSWFLENEDSTLSSDELCFVNELCLEMFRSVYNIRPGLLSSILGKFHEKLTSVIVNSIGGFFINSDKFLTSLAARVHYSLDLFSIRKDNIVFFEHALQLCDAFRKGNFFGELQLKGQFKGVVREFEDDLLANFDNALCIESSENGASRIDLQEFAISMRMWRLLAAVLLKEDSSGRILAPFLENEDAPEIVDSFFEYCSTNGYFDALYDSDAPMFEKLGDLISRNRIVELSHDWRHLYWTHTLALKQFSNSVEVLNEHLKSIGTEESAESKVSHLNAFIVNFLNRFLFQFLSSMAKLHSMI
jgi:hypothetical protein